MTVRHKKLGKMSYEEIVVAISFVCLSLLWLFRADLAFGDNFKIPGKTVAWRSPQAGPTSSRRAPPTFPTPPLACSSLWFCSLFPPRRRSRDSPSRTLTTVEISRQVDV